MGAVRRLLAAAVLACVSAPAAFAQGQSLSGVVVDSGGGLIPGASVVARNNATGESFDAVTNAAGTFSFPAIAVGTYTVTVTLQGFKTAVVNDVRVLTATPASVKAVLEVGVALRNGRSQGRLGAGSDPVDDGDLDDRRGADLRAAGALEQCALLRRDAARRRDDRRTARLDLQRPAQQHHQRHDRRRDHRQPAAIDRRLLLDGHAAARRGRGSHGHGCDARSGERPRRGADCVHDPVGHQRVQQQPLSLLQAPEPELQLLLQQDQRAREEPGHRPPVRRALGRTDRDPGVVRRPQPGVLLLQLRAPPPAERSDAHADDPESRCAARRIRLSHRGRHDDRGPAAGGGAQAADRDDRSDQSQRFSQTCAPRPGRPDR